MSNHWPYGHSVPWSEASLPKDVFLNCVLYQCSTFSKKIAKCVPTWQVSGMTIETSHCPKIHRTLWPNVIQLFGTFICEIFLDITLQKLSALMHELRETTSKIITFLYWIKIYYKFYTGFKVQHRGVSDPKVWDCLGRCQNNLKNQKQE